MCCAQVVFGRQVAQRQKGKRRRSVCFPSPTHHGPSAPCAPKPVPHSLPSPVSPAPRTRPSFADRVAQTRHFSRRRASQCGGGFGRRRPDEAGLTLPAGLRTPGPQEGSRVGQTEPPVWPRVGAGLGAGYPTAARKSEPQVCKQRPVGVRAGSPTRPRVWEPARNPFPPPASAPAPGGRARSVGCSCPRTPRSQQLGEDRLEAGRGCSHRGARGARRAGRRASRTRQRDGRNPPTPAPRTDRHTSENQGEGLEREVAQAGSRQPHCGTPRAPEDLPAREHRPSSRALSPGLCAAPRVLGPPGVAAASGPLFIHVGSQSGSQRGGRGGGGTSDPGRPFVLKQIRQTRNRRKNRKSRQENFLCSPKRSGTSRGKDRSV